MTKLNLTATRMKNSALTLLITMPFATYAFAGEKPNSNNPLSFGQAIKIAQKNDPWLVGNHHKQRVLESMSSAANTWADPQVSVGLANLPVNGFDFTQEGMTQVKVGIAQMFPRGDSLTIKSQQFKIESEAFPYQRKNRQATVAVTVGSLWLDAYRVQQSIALIEKNRSLFEQLVDVAQVSYSSALGKSRQQDVVRAQLELTRLEDRLSILAQQSSRYLGMMSSWLSDASNDDNAQVTFHQHYFEKTFELEEKLPEIELLNVNLASNEHWLTPNELVHFFTSHPSVVAVDKKINATKTGIKLAEEKYQPQWGVNASYGYRADTDMGSSRADLFSVGVTFDLPLFTENKQDKELQAAISETEAVKTEKTLLIRQLLSGYASAKGRLLRLEERQKLYQEKLMPQVHSHVQATLSAYTNDDGEFSEVVRARISLLNSEIDLLTLAVEEQKIRLELNYLFIGEIKITNAEQNLYQSNRKQTAAVIGEQE